MDKEIFIKKGVQYYQKQNGTIYCQPLDQSGKVGGNQEVERNKNNLARLHYIEKINPDAVVLDYGCGNGMFVDFISACMEVGRDVKTVCAYGYDPYSIEHRFNQTPLKENYDVVVMTEVIEHLSEPYSELDDIWEYLKPGGTLLVETSFVDWMTIEDEYFDPELGHSTIFSHQGLNELMLSKGFEIGEHINRNVRVFKKPMVDKNANKITLITMAQGNMKAFKRTLDNTKQYVDEVVFGDMLLFEEDREVLKSYRDSGEYNLKIVRLPFNYIYKNGFAETLNQIASQASNDMVLYLNVAEIIEEGTGAMLSRLNPRYNCYFFTHRVDPHKWVRLYNRRQLWWSGPIHEEVVGDRRLYPQSVFVMADTEKDMDDEFKARVFNDVKEINYFSQYIRMIDDRRSIGATNMNWVKYAAQEYDGMKERLLKKGKRLEAFETGDFKIFLEDIYHNVEFQNEEHTSTDIINYQGKRKAIL